MRYRCLILLLVAVTAVAPAVRVAGAESLYESFRGHNHEMTKVQPTWVAPVFQPDARLGQGIRFSVSQMWWPGGRVYTYGNNRGLTLLAGKRVQVDLTPPSFFRNHSPLLKDGWGNAMTQVKYRIASGNAEHGNYVVTAALLRAFSPRAEQNGGLTGAWLPRLIAGKQWGRVVALGAVNGVLPTGRVKEQGRLIEWSTTTEFHASKQVWLALEDNAAHYYGSPADGKTQNFLTPEAIWLPRRKDWGPTHAIYVLAAGMQVATSGFYPYNHNLVTEFRVLF